MTVAQKTKNREPHLYQVKKPSNIKTDPDDDDVDSLKAKPKTRHKKESKVRKHCKSHAYTCNNQTPLYAEQEKIINYCNNYILVCRTVASI